MSLDDPATPHRPSGGAAPAPRRPGAVPPEPEPPDDVEQPPGNDRARAMLLPVNDPEQPSEGDDGIRAVLPGPPRPAPLPSRPAAAPVESGLVCWRCGVANNTERVFCRNCGAELRNPPRPVAAPPAKPRSRARIALVIAAVVAAVVAVAAVVLTPSIVRSLRDRRDGEVAAVSPAQVTATSFDPRHPPRLAFDGTDDTAWTTGRPGAPDNATIQADFAEPVDIRQIRVVPSVSGDARQRAEQARPERIDLVIVDARGRRTTSQHRLDDGKTLTVRTSVDEAKRVQLVVRTAFGVAPDRQVAVAEITVFRAVR